MQISEVKGEVEHSAQKQKTQYQMKKHGIHNRI
jgi:hypothetical protein